MPKGSLRNLYLPSGVANVVRKLLALSSSSCRKPEVASSVEKTLDFYNFENISVTVGSAKCSLMGSGPTRNEPSGFSTLTIG